MIGIFQVSKARLQTTRESAALFLFLLPSDDIDNLRSFVRQGTLSLEFRHMNECFFNMRAESSLILT